MSFAFFYDLRSELFMAYVNHLAWVAPKRHAGARQRPHSRVKSDGENPPLPLLFRRGESLPASVSGSLIFCR